MHGLAAARAVDPSPRFEPMPTRLLGRRFRALLVAAVLTGGFQGLAPRDVKAFSGISQQKGFDTCAAPTKTTMSNWWTNSPYYNIGIYIGGSSRGCAQPNLTASWVTAVQSTHGDWGATSDLDRPTDEEP